MPKISIENKIENLEAVLDFIEQFARNNNLSQSVSFDINLAASELVSNIIQYAFTDDLKHVIDISIKQNPAGINLQIIDDGKEFNILNAKDVNVDLPLEDRPVGGLGIFLVRQKMDEINYARRDGKNILSLTKKIN